MKFQWTAARLTSISFLSLIAIGTIFLSIPAATTSEAPARIIDALFTAVSAVCVTGLIVQDTPHFFSTYGQIVILILVQLGGLGIMTLSASLPVLFGKQVKVSRRELLHGMLEQKDYYQLRNTLKNIVKYTLIIETIGAVILTLRWYALWGDFKKALFYGIFHSISAFCNAGFALFTNSLIPFSNDLVITSTIMILIILGGLGFLLLTQIFTIRSLKKLTAHAKLTLTVTGIFIFLPAIFIFFSEFSGSLIDYSTTQKVSYSLFQSITARTAGFNTINIESLGNASLFLICILMFVGGAPGGTAGGVKVTTISILFLSIRSLFLGREQIELFGRRITLAQVTKAIAILAVSFAVVTTFMIILLIVEEASFKQIFFETISAFGTVGLSLGITPELSTLGKLVISALMLTGRLGPLTLVFLIGTQKEKLYYRYPEGQIMLG